jgi:hypothetical protein
MVLIIDGFEVEAALPVGQLFDRCRVVVLLDGNMTGALPQVPAAEGQLPVCAGPGS